MDRGDALTLFELLLSARLPRRIVTTAVVALALSGWLAPGLRLPERAAVWVAEASAERVEDVMNMFIASLADVSSPPADTPGR